MHFFHKNCHSYKLPHNCSSLHFQPDQHVHMLRLHSIQIVNSFLFFCNFQIPFTNLFHILKLSVFKMCHTCWLLFFCARYRYLPVRFHCFWEFLLFWCLEHPLLPTWLCIYQYSIHKMLLYMPFLDICKFKQHLSG